MFKKGPSLRLKQRKEYQESFNIDGTYEFSNKDMKTRINHYSIIYSWYSNTNDKITKLKLRRYPCLNIEGQEGQTKNIFNVICSIKKVQSLTLNLRRINDSQYKYFKKVIYKCPHLRTLNVEFSPSSQVITKRVCNHFNHLKHLKKIKLDIGFRYSGLAKDSVSLYNMFRRQRELNRVCLSLNNRNVEKGFIAMLGTLQGFRMINELYLRNKGSSLSVHAIGRYPLKGKQRVVDVSIGTCTVDDFDMKKMVNYMRAHQYVYKIYLDFYSPSNNDDLQITSEKAPFQTLISQVKGLSKIEINFNFLKKFSQQEFFKFLYYPPFLKHLSSANIVLNMETGQWKISARGIDSDNYDREIEYFITFFNCMNLKEFTQQQLVHLKTLLERGNKISDRLILDDLSDVGSDKSFSSIDDGNRIDRPIYITDENNPYLQNDSDDDVAPLAANNPNVQEQAQIPTITIIEENQEQQGDDQQPQKQQQIIDEAQEEGNQQDGKLIPDTSALRVLEENKKDDDNLSIVEILSNKDKIIEELEDMEDGFFPDQDLVVDDQVSEIFFQQQLLDIQTSEDKKEAPWIQKHLRVLFFALEQMTSLQELTLSFFECKDISEAQLWTILQYGNHYLKESSEYCTVNISETKKLINYRSHSFPKLESTEVIQEIAANKSELENGKNNIGNELVIESIGEKQQLPITQITDKQPNAPNGRKEIQLIFRGCNIGNYDEKLVEKLNQTADSKPYRLTQKITNSSQFLNMIGPKSSIECQMENKFDLVSHIESQNFSDLFIHIDGTHQTLATNSTIDTNYPHVIRYILSLDFPLKAFELHLTHVTSFKKQQFMQILTQLSKKQELTHVSIKLQKCFTLENSELQIFNDLTKSLKNLTSYHIELDKTQNFDNQSVAHLMEGLNRIKNATQLSVCLHNCTNLSDEAFLLFKVYNLKKIQTIKMHFTGNSKFTDKALNAFSISELKQLRDVDINFGTSSNNPNELTPRQLYVRKMKDLNSLRLNFNNSNAIDDSDIRNLNLKKFDKLESLYLSFANCSELSHESFKYFHLDKIQSLQNLGLDFNSSKFKLKKGFGFIFNNKILNLHELSLNFSNSEEIYEKNLKSFNLSRFKQLVSLKMNFSGCTKLNNQSLRCIFHNSLPKLKHFDLNISQCTQITSRNFRYFNNFRSLITLKADFSYCTGITKFFRHVNFQNMDRLTHLDINLTKSGISRDDLGSLDANSLKHLNEVHFRIDGLSSQEIPLKLYELKVKLSKYLNFTYDGLLYNTHSALANCELAAIAKNAASIMNSGYRRGGNTINNLINALDL